MVVGVVVLSWLYHIIYQVLFFYPFLAMLYFLFFSRFRLSFSAATTAAAAATTATTTGCWRRGSRGERGGGGCGGDSGSGGRWRDGSTPGTAESMAGAVSAASHPRKWVAAMLLGVILSPRVFGKQRAKHCCAPLLLL